MYFKKEKLTEKQKRGYLGESYAVKWLSKNGFKTIARNYRKKWGEIDIVAQKGGVIHFVEVKTVTRGDLLASNLYEPEDNIHPWKLKRLQRTIESYLMEKDIDEDTDWQLDLLAIYLDLNQKVLKIDYLPDIF